MTTVLTSLFLSAFLSATLLPGSSEILLAAILMDEMTSIWLVVLVATFGNTLGSCVNWGIGRYLSGFRYHRRFPLKPEKYDRYVAWYGRWGIWSLLVSWVPVIGDPLTIIAGVARTSLPLFTAIVFAAKGIRYTFVAGAVAFLW